MHFFDLFSDIMRPFRLISEYEVKLVAYLQQVLSPESDTAVALHGTDR